MINISQLKTSPELLTQMRQAPVGRPSSRELFEQRVSFVYGSMAQDSGVTREQVRKVILAEAADKFGSAE